MKRQILFILILIGPVSLHAQIIWNYFPQITEIVCAEEQDMYLIALEQLELISASNPQCDSVSIDYTIDIQNFLISLCDNEAFITVEAIDTCGNTIEDIAEFRLKDTFEFDFENYFEYQDTVLDCIEEIEFLPPLKFEAPPGSCLNFDSIEEDYEPISSCELEYYRYNLYEDKCTGELYEFMQIATVIDSLSPEWIGDTQLFLPHDFTLYIENCQEPVTFPNGYFEDFQTGDFAWPDFPLVEGKHFLDNCAAHFLLLGPPPTENFPVGTTTIKYVIGDECENILEHSFTVTVECNPCGEGSIYPSKYSCEADSLSFLACENLVDEVFFSCTGDYDGVNAAWPNTLCNGFGPASNLAWFTFIADRTDYNIEITPFSCTTGNAAGITAGVYDFCEDEDGECIGGNTLDCMAPGEFSVEFSLSDLVIGNIYYLFVNGCNGSECEFIIDFDSDKPASEDFPFPLCNINESFVKINYYCDVNGNRRLDANDTIYQFSNQLSQLDPVPNQFTLIDNSQEWYLVDRNVGYSILYEDNEFKIKLLDNFEPYGRLQEYNALVIKDSLPFTAYEISISPQYFERCERVIPFHIKISNEGNLPLDKILVLEYDTSLKYKNSSQDPSLELPGIIEWEFTDDVSSSNTIIAYLRMPNIFFTGDIFCLNAYFKDAPELSIEYCFELRCSYDPNDKHGTPYRGGHNFVSFDEKLNYTIRFENLGNDTAFDIRIEDQLSEYLDPFSFKYLQSSHTMTGHSISEDGRLIMYFNDIELPSIKQDTILNKGFVQFSIESQDSVQLKSVVTNQAEIYFDQNPAVITNMTSHILVDEVPAVIIDDDNDGYDEDEDCNDNDPDINPGADEIPNNDIDENCDGIALIIDLDGDGFNSDEDCNDNDPEINPDAEEIPNNNTDENCDGLALIIDMDGDGFNSDEDCNDNDPDINPDAEEIPNNNTDENCDGLVLIIDMDDDGFNSDEDCNDNDPEINPDAEEIPNNTTDENCDGLALIIDIDGDGFNSDEDCNDDDPDINPDAEDIPGNGIDENCDGEDLITSTDERLLESLKLYPNPVNEVLYVDKFLHGEFHYRLYNIKAELIGKSTLGSNIDFSNLPSGVYLLYIIDSSENIFSIRRIFKS